MCGQNGNIDSDLCENWIKASSMSPLMKMTVDSGEPDDVSLKILFKIKHACKIDLRFSLVKNEMFEVFNASLHLRYSLLPYFYTQFWKATKYGTVPVRPLAFE